MNSNSHCTYAVCIDYTEAFDFVPHEKLWHIMLEMGISSKPGSIAKTLVQKRKEMVQNQKRLRDKATRTISGKVTYLDAIISDDCFLEVEIIVGQTKGEIVIRIKKNIRKIATSSLEQRRW